MVKKNFWLAALFVLGVAVLFGWLFRGQQLETEEQVAVIAQPTEAPRMEIGEATNSEGNLKLSGVSQKSTQGNVEYSFKVMETQKKTERPLYETVADSENEMQVPINSWSPDSKQVFIKASGLGGDNYLVFKASGEPYIDGKKYLSVMDYWTELKMKGNIDKITGWAGDDLLMVYTVNSQGDPGQAYWFVTSTRKFVAVREF